MKVRSKYDAEDLGVAEGLSVALARMLDPLAEGEALELVSENPSVGDDLQAWCRRTGHKLVRIKSQGHRWLITIERGFVQRTLADSAERGVRLRVNEGSLDMRDWHVGRHGIINDEVPPAGALAPRGASLERGATVVEFSIHRRSEVWADLITELYEQAVAGQWQGARDIPWGELKPLDEQLEQAVCQIMTFLAENEYAALYLPARFLGQIHPHYIEVALFLSTVVADEARHIEVFTKRALANGGGLGIATSATQLSLTSLFKPFDFSTASFLLSVLGEGTFLDLLAFLAEHAPENSTREICQRARRDEARHVHFGIAHAQYAFGADSTAGRRLEAAVEKRAGFLQSVSGVGSIIEEALIIYAGGGMSPACLRVGTARVISMYQTMHVNRVKRLTSIGFDRPTADRMSRLHTPNFM